MMKECAAYDNLPAKQSRWEISLRNARDLFLDPRPSSHKSNAGDIYWAPINFRLAHPINHTFDSVRNRLVSLPQVWPESESPLLDLPHLSGRLEHRQISRR